MIYTPVRKVAAGGNSGLEADSGLLPVLAGCSLSSSATTNAASWLF